jgi:demethylmenaquinone methyltransferase / 2-methoxy-6-polyprenyl-1,4-benzoquinol methylase
MVRAICNGYATMTDRAAGTGAMETSFGYRTVDAGSKQPLVDDVFHKVAERYDLMNDIMSSGLHRLWKDSMVAWLNPPRRAGWRLLDVAGGTGDIAFRIYDASDRQADVTVLDINGSMLQVGRERAQKLGLGEAISFVEANAEQLPFEDASFDAYTIAFGIRNVPRIGKALEEAHRVLKTGGRFLCLEFSEVEMPLLDRAYEAWSFHVIPRIGQMVAGDGEPYRYLVESIRRFPRPDAFASMIKTAGLERVKWRGMTGGIATIHSAWKL